MSVEKHKVSYNTEWITRNGKKTCVCKSIVDEKPFFTILCQFNSFSTEISFKQNLGKIGIEEIEKSARNMCEFQTNRILSA